MENLARATYSCSTCDKTFTHKENLSRHSKTHAVHRKHACPTCARTFTRSDLLKRHRLRHEDAVVDGPGVSGASPPKRRRLDDENAGRADGMGDLPVMEISTPLGSASWQTADLMTSDGLDDSMQDFVLWDATLDQLYLEGEDFVHSLHPLQGAVDGFASAGDHLPVPAPNAPDISDPEAASSPPNEPSAEDRTPFAWSPSSKRILEPREIDLLPGDPCLAHVDPGFQLGIVAYERVKACFEKDLYCGTSRLARAFVPFPRHEVVNFLLAQFRRHFLPQAPAIHLATFNLDSDAPEYIVAIMAAIGAVYTERKSARRLSIIMQDLARVHMRVAVDADDSLLKDPMTIYAGFLICYAGLWCGNKRAFELAEALRGNLIAWVRRLPDPAPFDRDKVDRSVHWYHQWAQQESCRRIRWIVYMLDCQYASLMNTSASMSLLEVIDWSCPCDEEYWSATTPRRCKALLGEATIPPTRAFAAAVSPFLKEHDEDAPPLASLNAFSAFLVLLTINMRILAYTAHRDVAAKLDSTHGYAEHLSPFLTDGNTSRPSMLRDSLFRWRQCYNHTHSSPYESCRYFWSVAGVLSNYCDFQLGVAVPELQNILGRSGEKIAAEAKEHLFRMLADNMTSVTTMLTRLTDVIDQQYCSLVSEREQNLKQQAGARRNASYPSPTSMQAPYISVFVFLAYAWFYACCISLPEWLKAPLVAELQTHLQTLDPAVPHKVHEHLIHSLADERGGGGSVLRSGAHILSLMKYWGCSANISLLLRLRGST